MKLLLIKIGKAWNVLKRDGIWRGGKRVFLAFFRLFKQVKPGDILFISNGVGDSARYRTTHVAEELEHQGLKTAGTIQENPFLLSYVDQFSIFVFQRVLYTEKVAQFVTAIKKQGKTIIFETDDLVYDPEFLKHMDYYTKMNTLERKLYEHGVGGEILADPYVQVCTTTTDYLARKLREKGKRVFVVKSKLSKQDVMWAKQAVDKKATSPTSSDTVRLGYFSGTPSHNKDFATIAPVLEGLLIKYSQVRLVLAGPLDIHDGLYQYGSQIERVAFAPRQEHFHNVAQVDINLAPLEIDNPFCESKSELKWFEAAIVSVPTVAAATEPFRLAITDGVDGFVAATAAEWEEKLEALIVDTEARKTMGDRARQTVLARYTTGVGDNEEYYRYLKSKINQGV